MAQAEGAGPSGNTAQTVRVTDTLRSLAAQWFFTIKLIRELSLSLQQREGHKTQQRLPCECLR